MPPAPLGPPLPAALVSQLRHRARQLRRIQALQWLAWSAAAATGCVGVGLLGAATRRLGVVDAAGAAALGCAGLGALAAGFSALGAGQAPEALLATALGRALPAWASALRTATAPYAAAASPVTQALAAAHAERLAAALAGDALTARLAHTRRRRLRWPRGAAATAALACALLALAVPRAAGRLGQRWRGAPVVEASAGAGCFDVTVQVTYPAYTGWPPWTQTGTTGEVRALRGSTVVLDAQPDAPTRAAWLRTWPTAADGSCAGPVPLRGAHDAPARVTAAGRIVASHRLAAPRCYAFVRQGEDGIWQVDSVAHALVAVADAPPTATLLAPQTEVVLPAHAALDVHWQAEDDVGLAGAALRVTDGNDEILRVPLALAGQRRRVAGQLQLQADALPFVGQAPLTLQLEVRDGHAPAQQARSAAVVLRRASPQAQHQANLQQLLQAQNILVDWLAQEWLVGEAAPAGAPPLPPLADVVQAAEATFTALADRLAPPAGGGAAATHAATPLSPKDAKAAAALHAVARQVADHAASARRNPLTAANARRRHTVAQDTLLLDSLQRRGSAEQLATDAGDVGGASAALRAQLQAPPPAEGAQAEARRALLRSAFAQLQGRVAKLLQQAQASKQAMPRNFANVDAQANDRWQQTLARIDADLQAGRDAEAGQELAHLQQMVDELAASAAEAAAQAAPPAFAAAQQTLQALAQEVAALAQGQNAVVAQLAQARQTQLARALGAPVTTVHAQALAALDRAQAALRALSHGETAAADVGPEATALRRALEGLRVAVAQGQLPRAQAQLAQASHASEALGDRAQALATASPHAARAAKTEAERTGALLRRLRGQLAALDDANPPLNDPAQAPVARALAALARTQASLAKGSDEASAKMAALQQQLPMLGEAGQDKLQAASAAMRQATGALQRRRLGDAGQGATLALQALRDFLAAAEAQAKAAAAAGVPLPLGDGPPDDGGDVSGAGQAGAGTAGADAPGAGAQAAGAGKPGSGAAGQAQRGGQGEPGGTDRPGAAPGHAPGQAQGDGAGGANGTGGPGQAPPEAQGHGGQAAAGDDVDLTPGAAQNGPSLRDQLRDAQRQPPPPRYAPAVRRYYDELLH